MGNKLRREGDEVRIKVIWPDPLVQADAEWEVIYATGDYGTKLAERRVWTVWEEFWDGDSTDFWMIGFNIFNHFFP